MHSSPSFEQLSRANKPKRRQSIQCPLCQSWVKNIRLHSATKHRRNK